MEKTILVIGGAFQNKTEATLHYFGLTQADVAVDFSENKRIIRDFHEYFRKNTNDEALLEKCRGRIIVCDEIGCGIIPLEKADREYREALGRFLCQLAHISDTVLRITCGIPTVIKGE